MFSMNNGVRWYSDAVVVLRCRDPFQLIHSASQAEAGFGSAMFCLPSSGAGSFRGANVESMFRGKREPAHETRVDRTQSMMTRHEAPT
eukprot:1690926-Rhodomonas_salina.1